MTTPTFTYGRLEELLTRLRFTAVVEPTRRLRAYRHPGTRALVLFAERPPEAPLPEGEWLTVRRQLAEKGHLASEEVAA